MKRDVVRVRWCAEALTDEVVCRIETCHFDELREIDRLQPEVLDSFDCAFDVFERDEDVDELFLKLHAALTELSGNVHLASILDETNDDIRDVEFRMKFELFNQDGGAD